MKGARRGSPRRVERQGHITFLRFTVPLPPQSLSLNSKSRSSRLQKSSAVKAYREEVALLTRGAMNAPHWAAPALARVNVAFLMARGPVPDGFYRPIDAANAVIAFKAGFDGLKLDAVREWPRQERVKEERS